MFDADPCDIITPAEDFVERVLVVIERARVCGLSRAQVRAVALAFARETLAGLDPALRAELRGDILSAVDLVLDSTPSTPRPSGPRPRPAA